MFYILNSTVPLALTLKYGYFSLIHHHGYSILINVILESPTSIVQPCFYLVPLDPQYGSHEQQVGCIQMSSLPHLLHIHQVPHTLLTSIDQQLNELHH